MPPPDSPIHRYHDGTKHFFNRFSQSLGYLDWASQPNPFRSYDGARRVPLFPSPEAPPSSIPRRVTYHQLFDEVIDPLPVTAGAIGDMFRHALGLSAWKQYGRTRWSLRVNPSSGNLHPTEAYLICGSMEGLDRSAGVYHYMADRHALEQRCRFDQHAWAAACGGRHLVLMALTSIHWRESWKYGERAFRYCQHDLGHAIAAVSFAARTLGWCANMLPAWSHRALATLIGLDRDQDFVDAEREDPGCILALTFEGRSTDAGAPAADDVIAAVRAGEWSGRASQLSEDHVQWAFIDDIARETDDPGRAIAARPVLPPMRLTEALDGDGPVPPAPDARGLFLQRRSALAFDGVSSIHAKTFFAMLARVMPAAGAPWDAQWWTPRIHLLLFVHRVDGLAPGIYVLGRAAHGLDRLLGAIDRLDLREPAHDSLPLVRLAHGDCRGIARRLSCDQDIAADGFYSLGMIAEFDASLEEHGPAFYRHVFWESGIVGQVLYLEAEAAGVRATGIGCFYDDPVHDLLGLKGHAFQSLYHFTAGMPIEDMRLTTEPGYRWG